MPKSPSFTVRTLFAISIFSLAVLASAVALGGPEQDLMAVAHANWNRLRQKPAAPPAAVAVGQVAALPMTALIRGQDRVSFLTILNKVPSDEPIDAIKIDGGFVMVDGHHDFFFALANGAEEMKVRIVEDWSHVSRLQAWRELKRRRLVYLDGSAEQLAEKTPEMFDVTDEPNRFLATALARKIKIGPDGKIAQINGLPNAIWVKVGGSIPFIELDIARVLTDSGIHYDPSWGTAIPDAVVEASRKALMAAQKTGFPDSIAKIEVISSAVRSCSATIAPKQ